MKISGEKRIRSSKGTILSNINSNGGFDNFNSWNVSEITQWVISNFNCSKNLAIKVAYELI